MRFLACCLAAVLSVPVLAQQKSTAPGATKAKATATTKASARELTPDEYRDLILNTPDAIYRLGLRAFGDVMPGLAGTEYIDGQSRRCIMKFTYSPSAGEEVSKQRKAWASAHVPQTLRASHAQILQWMEVVEAYAKKLPTCMEPFLQAGPAQYEWNVEMGG